MKTKSWSVLLVSALISVLLAGTLLAEETQGVTQRYRVYAESSTAMIAVSFDLEEENELSALTVDLGANSEIDAIYLCPSGPSGGPDIDGKDLLASVVRSGLDGPMTIALSRSRALGSGTWWGVIAVTPSYSGDVSRESPRLTFRSATGTRTVLCGTGDAGWARVAGVEPVLDFALAPAALVASKSSETSPQAGSQDFRVTGYVSQYKGALPNPARSSTEFHFTLAGAGDVRLDLFDARGRVVRRLGPTRFPAGPGLLRWDRTSNGGGRVASGVYFARFRGPGLDVTSRILLLK